MTKLRFRYYMKLSFSGSVNKHRFTLKCIPETDPNQRILITKKEIYPNSFISEGTDSFGNQIIYGYEEADHKHFFFDIEGEAEINITENKTVNNKLSLFKYQTDITRPGGSILEYYKDLSEKYDTGSKGLPDIYGLTVTDDTIRYALYIMHRLNRDYEYVSGVTDIQTDAESAMQCRKGVCQDYAHIMLSLCRIKKIPCRYVTGMMLGEGKSHAWVEIHSDNGWIGMDPTNSQIAGEHYIKIAHGRDYSDCLVNQGIFTGNVTQQQDISVTVEEMK